MRASTGQLLLAFLSACAVSGCGAKEGAERSSADASAPVPVAEPATTPVRAREVASAGARLADVRARFRVAQPVPPHDVAPGRSTEFASVVGVDVATHFERYADGRLRAALPVNPRHAAARSAAVTLPARAGGAVEVVDEASRVGAAFALRGAADVAAEPAGGVVLFPGAAFGADLLLRVHDEGAEDFVVFELTPAREELVYDVQLARVAGLRLVSDTLELLDPGGTPRLRIAPPTVVDAKGTRTLAHVTLEGCAFDADPRAPWGRAVVPAEATSCVVRVRWAGVTYPALVDPAWTTTGSMAQQREMHQATLLPSGRVLVSGGGISGLAELFDPAGTGTFAATGSMAARRMAHTATWLGAGRVLIAGGDVGAADSTSAAELYDTATGAFAPLAPMTTARRMHTATLLTSGKVLVTGGLATSGELSSAELFDPSGAGAFLATASMPRTMFEHTATLLTSGKVFVVGGGGAALFDPAGAGSFAPGPSIVSVRRNHTATLLPSGLVLVVGGYGTYGAETTAELFDPSGSAGSTLFPAKLSYRWAHTATLLSSGRVLLAGGYGGSAASSTAELLDPATGRVSPLSPMHFARYYYASAPLGSDRVLMVGGDGVVGSTAEIFALVAAGDGCSAAADCASGVCDGGVCCAAACPNGGVCQTCVAGTGACQTVTSGADADSCAGTCDALGVCRVTTGKPCPAAFGQCASGFCSDGVCCDAACAGACDVCTKALGASADGACTIAPAGTRTCGSYVCAGAAACPVACATDGDCIAGYYCGASGSCVVRIPQGGACDAAAGKDCRVAGCRNCATGSCADGVCCDRPCDGLCEACRAATKQSGVTDGLCGPAKNGSSPLHGTCPTDPASSCRRDGLCNGNGGCRSFYAAGTPCAASVCSGTSSLARACNGSGGCATASTGTNCAPGTCAAGTCVGSCASDAECAPGAFCSAGHCAVRRDNGKGCLGDSECASSTCVDGVCCNTRCVGQCEACDVAGSLGTCTAVVGKPHGARTQCPDGGALEPCAAASCDGAARTACAKLAGADVVCGEDACMDGQAIAKGRCDGAGACAATAVSDCGAFACGPTACLTTCASKDDCAPNNRCDALGNCTATAHCASVHVLEAADGTLTDCSPFLCEESGACKTSCSKSDDCVAGLLCADGKCVEAPTATSASGGCSQSPTRTEGEPTWAWLAVGLVAMAMARGRRVGGQAR
jgi:hypothetical protein